MPSTNEHLFTLRAELANFGAQNYYIEHANRYVKQSLAELTGRTSFTGSGNFEIKFPNVAGALQRGLPQPEQLHLQCKGDFSTANIEISANFYTGNKVILANAKRERLRITGAHWDVQLQPGVDAAFVVAILVAVNDRRRNR
jgi:hypothetical protein